MPKIKYVEKAFFAPQSVTAGADVHVLFYEESKPHVITAKVDTLAPMALTTKDSSVKRLKPDMRSILVTEKNGSVAKAECRVKVCEAVGKHWHLEVDVTAWEEVDRRRFPRHQIELPIRMRMVTEQEGSPQISEVLALTKDVSLGGMLVQAGEELKAGSLVEVQAVLRGKEHLRVLAVVVRAGDDSDFIGLEFLDFVGGSRYSMHGFLSDAA